MKISQSFIVQRPRPTVWAFFQDVSAVSACMPGAELTEDRGGGLYAGKVGIKLGPFNASFEGAAQVMADVDTHSGHVEGKGTDKRGGSRSRLVLDYRLTEAGNATQVDVDADVQLSGPVAQFGRTGIITETANVLIGQFVQNVEARLAASPEGPEAGRAPALPQEEALEAGAPPAAGRDEDRSPSASLNLLALLKSALASYLRRIFRRGGRVQR